MLLLLLTVNFSYLRRSYKGNDNFMLHVSYIAKRNSTCLYHCLLKVGITPVCMEQQQLHIVLWAFFTTPIDLNPKFVAKTIILYIFAFYIVRLFSILFAVLHSLCTSLNNVLPLNYSSESSDCFGWMQC